MIFVLDNYDSFTYNLTHMLAMLGAEAVIRRNREIGVDGVFALRPAGILLSPGPGRPENAGILCELVREAAARRVPVLGVCLGHQAIGQVFGAKVVHAKAVMHGKTSEITHDGKGIFSGIASPFKAVRYHSLALGDLPDCLAITAQSPDGEIMGVRHVSLPIEGIQYHPESILTVTGKRQLANFLEGTGTC